MQQKKATDYLQESVTHLMQVRTSLQSAMTSAEKPKNKYEIQNTLNTVSQALQQCLTVASSVETETQ